MCMSVCVRAGLPWRHWRAAGGQAGKGAKPSRRRRRTERKQKGNKKGGKKSAQRRLCVCVSLFCFSFGGRPFALCLSKPHTPVYSYVVDYMLSSFSFWCVAGLFFGKIWVALQSNTKAPFFSISSLFLSLPPFSRSFSFSFSRRHTKPLPSPYSPLEAPNVSYKQPARGGRVHTHSHTQNMSQSFRFCSKSSPFRFLNAKDKRQQHYQRQEDEEKGNRKKHQCDPLSSLVCRMRRVCFAAKPPRGGIFLSTIRKKNR